MPALECPAQRFLPWFGSNVENAPRVGELLRGCRYVTIPFAGGMSEIPHIEARELAVNDKHKLSIGLARCVADPQRRRRVLDVLKWLPVCDDVRERCKEILGHSGDEVERAVAYFVTQWMGRSGQAGKEKEFAGGVPIRTNANGGGTGKRYWSAVRSLAQWGETMRRCNFESMDWEPFLNQYGGDDEWRGIYCDPPWPDLGDDYLHKFNVGDQWKLADRMNGYQKARVVMRYGDHPRIRELYPESKWTWHLMDGRNQGNNAVREALIVRNWQ